MMAGVTPLKEKKKPVTEVAAVVNRNTNVQPSISDCGEQAVENDESSDNSDQTQDNRHESKGVHGDILNTLFLVMSMDKKEAGFAPAGRKSRAQSVSSAGSCAWNRVSLPFERFDDDHPARFCRTYVVG